MKSVLTMIDSDDGNASRIDIAAKLGSKFEAHVCGLHILPQLEPLLYTTAGTNLIAAPGHIYPPDFFKEREEELKSRAKKLLENFNSVMAKTQIQFDEHTIKGDKLKIMNAFSRCSDLTIISQGSSETADVLSTNTAFMLESGAPILAVPETVSHSKLGDNILIAWNGSAQSGRAVHFSLPFLKKAQNVVILSVGDHEGRLAKPEDLGRYLSLHGVHVIIDKKDDFDTPEKTILDVAEKNTSDLIIAGAWGHSRITELIMGGTTKNLFLNQKYPVFFAH